MRCRFIVNPSAGHERAGAHLQPIVERLCSHFGSVDVAVTQQDGDCRRAAHEAAVAGAEYVFVGGGDGTLNEALNGVATADALDRVTFGLVPFGTGNDFAAALGIADVEEAVDVLIGSTTTRVDVGLLNDRCFINVSAGGFIAAVSDEVDSRLKTVAGKLAYLLGAAPVLSDFQAIPGTLRVPTATGFASEQMDIELFAVCNSRLVGGGHPIAPSALIDDGELDLCLVRGVGPMELLNLLAQVPSGQHVDDPRVSYLRAAEFEFEFAQPIKVNTDGEVIALERCSYRVLPGAASFLCRPHPPFSKNAEA